MDKTAISLMCQKLREQCIDVNRMVIEDPDSAIDFIHGQYRIALSQLSQS